MGKVTVAVVAVLAGLIFASPSFARENLSFLTIVNPVRGPDFFQLEGERPVDNVKRQWEQIKSRNLNATWLLRPDVLTDEVAAGFFKTLPGNQELGLFMEITPTWTSQASVKYRQSQNWHFAGSVFLTGYEVEERQRLIDAAFDSFRQTFGFYPKSVGAWWIDATSLTYMREKYGIVANMDVADQWSTDNYQVWGQYFSTPYYPSKLNALVPAAGEGQKIGVVTIQWATRDPFNAYGNGVLDSTYSVQANDYANKKYHNLDTDYFQKLLSIYLDNPYSSFGQVTVGLENDFLWEEYGEEFTRQLEVVKERQKSGTGVLTMSEFAQEYSQLFPDISGQQVIYSGDSLGSGGSVLWFQNTRYRIGWFVNMRGSVVRDLRIYQSSVDEPCLKKSCKNLNLAMTENRNVDEVTYGDQWVIDEGKVSDLAVKEVPGGIEITYLNQSGYKRHLRFLENDIRIDENWSRPVSFAILEALEASKNLSKIEHNFSLGLKDGVGNVLITQLAVFGKFILFAVAFFYLPGLLVLKRAKLPNNTKFVLAWVVGLCAFTLTVYLLGYLKIATAVYLLPLGSLAVVRKNLLFPAVKLSKNIILAAVVIAAGSISWLATMVKNGLVFDYGMGFWGPHGHDAIWHLSLIEGFKKGLPPQNPIFAGTILHNYHYFYDLLLAATSQLTYISAVDLYFRSYPVLIAVLIGATAYLLAKDWLKSEVAAVLALFFVYFGGSFGWILSYVQRREFGGETTFWVQQSISTFLNPPYAISALLFLAGLILFQKLSAEKNYCLPLGLPLAILWGSLVEYKAYGGILTLGALGIVTLFQLLKRNLAFLKVSAPAAVLSLAVFLPNNFGSGSLLVFSPFWLVHSMVDFPDRLNWLRLSYARMAGAETGNWFKFIAAEALGFLIFLGGNLGSRIAGLGSPFFLVRDTFLVFITSFLALSLLASLLFIQKGANFNTVQFFYYFLLVFNFLTAYSLSILIKKTKTVGVLVTTVFIALTLPTTWNTMNQYLPPRPPARISAAELEALGFLGNQPDGVVLNYNFDTKLRKRYSEPVPILSYESTGYVAALSGKSEFVSDTVNLEILGVDYKGRLQIQKDTFALKAPDLIAKQLKENNISYLYVPKISGFSPDQGRLGIERIFQNSEVDIFKVKY